MRWGKWLIVFSFPVLFTGCSHLTKVSASLPSPTIVPKSKDQLKLESKLRQLDDYLCRMEKVAGMGKMKVRVYPIRNRSAVASLNNLNPSPVITNVLVNDFGCSIEVLTSNVDMLGTAQQLGTFVKKVGENYGIDGDIVAINTGMKNGAKSNNYELSSASFTKPDSKTFINITGGGTSSFSVSKVSVVLRMVNPTTQQIEASKEGTIYFYGTSADKEFAFFINGIGVGMMRDISLKQSIDEATARIVKFTLLKLLGTIGGLPYWNIIGDKFVTEAEKDRVRVQWVSMVKWMANNGQIDSFIEKLLKYCYGVKAVKLDKKLDKSETMAIANILKGLPDSPIVKRVPLSQKERWAVDLLEYLGANLHKLRLQRAKKGVTKRATSRST